MTRKEEREQAARDFESIEYKSPYTNFIQGAEWADETMIDKACEWLRRTQPQALLPDTTIEQFRKAMEE